MNPSAAATLPISSPSLAAAASNAIAAEATPQISIVVPVLDEEENIGPLHERLDAALGKDVTLYGEMHRFIPGKGADAVHFADASSTLVASTNSKAESPPQKSRSKSKN